MSFKNKVILITGASAGIGAKTAELFAKEGASVAIVGRNEEKLNSVALQCEEYGATVLSIKADISKDVEVDIIVEKTIEKFGKLDVLVNNAGIFKESTIFSDDFLDVFDETMNVNIRSVVRITRFAVPYLVETKGNIINISSTAARAMQVPNYIAYRTSKAAMNHFTRSVALELAPHGVRVNTVSPGPVRTEIFKGTSIKHADDLAQFTALKRISETEEIAELILFIASDKARGITGSDYVNDNGILLK